MSGKYMVESAASHCTQLTPRQTPADFTKHLQIHKQPQTVLQIIYKDPCQDSKHLISPLPLPSHQNFSMKHMRRMQISKITPIAAIAGHRNWFSGAVGKVGNIRGKTKMFLKLVLGY